MDTVWGPIRTMHRGWMTDESRRFYAAAGGSLTGLGIHLLESGKVDAILHSCYKRVRLCRRRSHGHRWRIPDSGSFRLFESRPGEAICWSLLAISKLS